MRLVTIFHFLFLLTDIGSGYDAHGTQTDTLIQYIDNHEIVGTAVRREIRSSEYAPLSSKIRREIRSSEYAPPMGKIRREVRSSEYAPPMGKMRREVRSSEYAPPMGKIRREVRSSEYAPPSGKIRREIRSSEYAPLRGKIQREIRSSEYRPPRGKIRREIRSSEYKPPMGKIRREIRSSEYKPPRGKIRREIRSSEYKPPMGKIRREVRSSEYKPPSGKLHSLLIRRTRRSLDDAIAGFGPKVVPRERIDRNRRYTQGFPGGGGGAHGVVSQTGGGARSRRASNGGLTQSDTGKLAIYNERRRKTFDSYGVGPVEGRGAGYSFLHTNSVLRLMTEKYTWPCHRNSLFHFNILLDMSQTESRITMRCSLCTRFGIKQIKAIVLNFKIMFGSRECIVLSLTFKFKDEIWTKNLRIKSKS